MSSKFNQLVQPVMGMALLIGFIILIYEIIILLIDFIKALDPNLAAGLLTASTTVIASISAITLGKYFERKREIESHFRDKKVDIYNSFLVEFYGVTTDQKQHESKSDEEIVADEEMVKFLNDWQRQMILWGGANVLSQYIKWKEDISRQNPTAQTMFLTENFFKALRKDIGLSNKGLKKGDFLNLFLQNANLLLTLSKTDPNITLAEIGKIEKKLQETTSELNT